MFNFNFDRVGALFAREFHLGFKSSFKIITILTLGIFLANFIISYFNKQSGGGNDDVSDTMIKYGLMLMIGGFIYTSLAFKEFQRTPSRTEYLALPGSSLEKAFVKWSFTNPIFIVCFTLLFWVLASLLMPYIADWRAKSYINEVGTTRIFWNLVGIYFILHSIFFFGSIAFNKVPAVMTIVAVVLIGLSLLLLNGLFFRIVWAEFFTGLWSFRPREGNAQFAGGNGNPADMWQIQFFIFAFKFLLAPVLWIASLFKLSEKQV